ncbi:HERC2, partial [Symbiodinium necroappetens]
EKVTNLLAQIQNLTEMLNGTKAGTVLFNETLVTAVGSIKVVALTAPDNPNESASVSAPGASTHIKLPASVLGKAQDAETGIALLSVTSVAANTTNAFDNLTSPSEDELGQKQKTELQSEIIISVNLRDSDGESLNLDKLEEPIELIFDIAVNTSDSMRCAFWDEEELRWSSEGVITASSSHPDQVRCLTTHLSIFGVVRYVALLTDIG